MRGRRPNLGDKKLGTMIKETIAASGPEGISQKTICEELGIPRMTAYRYCKRFEKDRKIRVTRVGRGAKYIAKSKIVMDPEIGAYIQGRQTYYKIMKIGRMSPVTSSALGINIHMLTELEVGLFNFSNIMGAVLTYILLQAMSQGNPVLHREYNRKGPYYMNDRRKDRLVRRWIDGFLSGILKSIPYKFRDFLYRKTGHYPLNYQDRVRLMKKKPGLSIDDPEVTRLSYEAFRNIYPSISNALNRISTELPKAVESHKASLEALEKNESTGFYEAHIGEVKEVEKKRKDKQAHIHRFKLLKVKANVKYFQCEICSRKKSELVRTL